MRNCTALRLAALFVVVSGCGGESRPAGPATVPVKLTVTINGKPIEGDVVLNLLPEPPKEGITAIKGVRLSDGSYALETYAAGDGAPPGTYAVKLGSTDATAIGQTVPQVKPASVIIPNEGGNVSVDLVGTGKKQSGLLPPPPGQGR